MKALDVHLLASRFEAMSMTLLESAACGVPSIATDVGGNREVIEDGVTGLLTASEPNEFASAIKTLATRVDFRRQLGERARERFMAEFTVAAMARRYEGIYSECAGVSLRSQLLDSGLAAWRVAG